LLDVQITVPSICLLATSSFAGKSCWLGYYVSYCWLSTVLQVAFFLDADCISVEGCSMELVLWCLGLSGFVLLFFAN
jgi:hypothetical protein